MDRDATILVRILRDAEQGMLSKRKWRTYGCVSEDEMQVYLDVLLNMGSIVQHPKPHSAVTDGHGRKRIIWENEPDYYITAKGRIDLQQQK